MVVQSKPFKSNIENVAADNEDAQALCTRDRLLIAIKNGPNLSREDAEAMNTLIQEARQGSLNDELHG